MKKYICYALTLVFMTFTLSATSGTWAGGVGDWNDNTKWSGATFPDNGEDATFPDGASVVTINVPVTLGTLTLNGNMGIVGLTTEDDFSVSTEIISSEAGKTLFFAEGVLTHNLGLPPTITGISNYFFVYNQTLVAGGTVTASGSKMYFFEQETLGNIPTLHLTAGSSLNLRAGSGSAITNLILDAGTQLKIGGGAVTNFSTNISGAGDTLVLEDASLIFTGTNSYLGGLTIEEDATVIGTTTSIPSGGCANAASLTFNQVADGIYSGVISGVGTFTKTGTGILTLSNTNTYTGTTTVTSGTLSVTGTINTTSITTVANGAELRGSGTVGQLTNNGTVQAGLVAGDTLTLSGAHNYLQAGGATFVSLIAPAAASSLVIPGTATLAGTLLLNVGAGAYPGSTTFTVLTTGGGVINQFDTLTETHVGDWQMRHNAATVEVFLPKDSPVVVTPVPLASLRGNDSIVGNYMFLDPSFVTSNTDLTLVANVMLALPLNGFRNSLIQVSPLATAANPQVQFQSNLQMAVVLDKQFQQTVKNTKRAKANENKKSVPCYGIPKTGLFIEPIGIFYHQRQTGGDLTNTGQVAFDSYTYGAGMGWEQVLDGQFVVEGGIGYTHSNLHWHENFGNSRWSTIYVAPFFGWFNERFFANFMVMGGFNFFKTDRTVAFGTINRNATSRYNSYDLLLRLNGGARIPFGKINWFQPEATLNYLTIFTEGYTETGASSINLQVQKNTTYIMQPSFRGKWIQEFKTKKFCYSPILYVGWLANIMLQPQTVSARFRDAPNRIFFNIEGYTGTVNQLILGAEFFVQRFNQFEITSTFEVDMLSHFEVYTGKVKFEWMF